MYMQLILIVILASASISIMSKLPNGINSHSWKKSDVGVQNISMFISSRILLLFAAYLSLDLTGSPIINHLIRVYFLSEMFLGILNTIFTIAYNDHRGKITKNKRSAYWIFLSHQHTAHRMKMTVLPAFCYLTVVFLNRGEYVMTLQMLGILLLFYISVVGRRKLFLEMVDNPHAECYKAGGTHNLENSKRLNHFVEVFGKHLSENQ